MRTNVVSYLVNTTSLYPQKEAVVDAKGSYTFARLLSNACDLCSVLNQYGVKRTPVGVYLDKSKEMVSGFAAINLAGGFYVPLDTHSPIKRVLSILSVLGAEYVVSDKQHAELLRAEWDGRIILIDEAFKHTDDYWRANEILNSSTGIDTDPVYSIFTSGSTGVPKGVVVAHRGVLDYIDWAVETFKIDHTTVIGNQAPFYFDNSTLDIYLMYATAATLNIIPEMNFAFPAKLIDYLNLHKINFVFWVPFVLISVANFDIFKSKKPEYLRDVFFAGEVMPNKHLNYWRRHLPNCRYANLYGPTEITVDCTYYVVDRDFRDDEPLPIGMACRNSDVIILVDQKREAKVNEEGELCVRGSSLSLGYYNDWEKTAKAFIQNPLNTHYPETIYCTGDIVYVNERGEIMYVGRKDAQIKHNGYRIELGEIENAILATNLVDNCCAVYDNINKRIVLFYQAQQELNMVEFKKATSKTIPRYMLPTEYHRQEVLRQNGSGKIDRSYYKKQVNA
jgi:amino acid adenylation domain-containing protein